MFYKLCLGLALGIVTLSLIGSFANANSVALSKQDFIDSNARRRSRTTHFVPVPNNRTYSSGSGNSGSSRSSYDNVRGGGPGSGK
ncbi:MAG: hypothetical protein AAFY33_16740 [Cyanobacteria bacterium J06643_4]